MPEDERWTSQEKFVWHRVCIGETADFNKEPDYGGYLDPKKPDNWPQNRILRPSFLETILLRDQYRRVLTRTGVNIVGARFMEELDLYGAQLGHGLGLNGSLFEKGANFSLVKSAQVIDFEGSKFAGALVMDGLRTDSYVFLRGAEFAEVVVRHARVGGLLELDKSKVTGKLDMDGLQVDKAVFMREAEFAEVVLRGARIAGQLGLTKSKVTGKLDMDGVQVGSSLLMDGAEFADVTLTGAHVVGQVALVGSKVTGELAMDGLQVDQYLFLHEAKFAKVVLRGARIGGPLELNNSKVTGKLEMHGAQLKSDLLMNQAEFADVSLLGAHIVGLVTLEGSKLTGQLDMGGLRADQHVFLRGAEFADVGLRSARVGGQLELTKSKVTGNLDMYGVQVGSALLMHEAEFADVVLRSARVGGLLDLAKTKVTGKLNMTMLQVDSSLSMANAEFAEVVMRGARVGGQLNLSEAKVTGKLLMEVLSVGAGLHMDEAELTEVNISSAHVGGELSLLGSKVSETLTMHAVRIDKDLFLGRGSEYHSAIHIVFGKIGGSLELTGGIFHDIVQLTGTQVTGELRLASSKDDLPRWLDQSALILRSARADAIQDLKDAWPPKNRLELTGFTYRSLGGVFTPERDSIGGRRVEWFQEWLGRQIEYTAAPYEHLATVLRSHGRAQDAQEILYASREGERADTIRRAWEEFSLGSFLESIGSFFQYAWLTILKCLIGYGYHIERTLIWVAVVIGAGIAVLKISGQGRKNGMPYGITYSFDMLLPIIELRKKHYDIDLEGWPRYYFYVHKIMGYVLASFLIAGIAGLTK